MLDDFVVKQLIEISHNLTFENQAYLTTLEDEHFGKVLRSNNNKLLLLTSLPHYQKKPRATLDKLWYLNCNKCKTTTGKINVPCGCLHPNYFVIGEAPGRANLKDRVIHRTMCFGPVAAMIRQTLNELGIHKQTWYTNLIKCSVDGNRKPLINEIKNCNFWLKTELRLLKPKVIFALGEFTYATLQKFNIKAIRLYHPAYFIRKGLNWKDYLRHVEKILGGNN